MIVQGKKDGGKVGMTRELTERDLIENLGLVKECFPKKAILLSPDA